MNQEEARYVRMFVSWLYVHGPDPNSMPREKLIAAYEEWIQTSPTAIIEAWAASREEPPLLPAS